MARAGLPAEVQLVGAMNPCRRGCRSVEGCVPRAPRSLRRHGRTFATEFLRVNEKDLVGPSGLATAISSHNTTASRAGAATRPPSPPWATPSWSSPGTCSGTAGRTGTSDMSTSTGWTETGSFVITPAGWRNLASSCRLLPRRRQPPDGLLSEDQRDSNPGFSLRGPRALSHRCADPSPLKPAKTRRTRR